MEWVATIIVGAMTSIVTVISVLVSNAKSRAITDYKIDQLTEKVKEHNNLITRMYNAEERISIIEEKIK